MITRMDSRAILLGAASRSSPYPRLLWEAHSCPPEQGRTSLLRLSVGAAQLPKPLANKCEDTAMKTSVRTVGKHGTRGRNVNHVCVAILFAEAFVRTSRIK
jgi:hypothetical protein